MSSLDERLRNLNQNRVHKNPVDYTTQEKKQRQVPQKNIIDLVNDVSKPVSNIISNVQKPVSNIVNTSRSFLKPKQNVNYGTSIGPTKPATQFQTIQQSAIPKTNMQQPITIETNANKNKLSNEQKELLKASILKDTSLNNAQKQSAIKNLDVKSFNVVGTEAYKQEKKEEAIEKAKKRAEQPRKFEVAKANYTLGKLTEDESKAWYKYRNSQSQEDYEEALNASAKVEDWVQNNKNIGKGDLLTKNLAEYLPQFINQQKNALAGAGIGGGAGAAVGSIIPGAGTVAGAIKGAGAGYTAGSAKYSYEQMAGQTYKDLLQLGIPNDIALKVSGNTALINSLIEGGETALSLITAGVGKLTGKATSTAVKQVAKNKLVEALKTYGINILSEGAEEGLQETVNILGENSAYKQSGMDKRVSLREGTQRVTDNTIGGMQTAVVASPLNAGLSYTTNSISNNRIAKNQVQNQNVNNVQSNVNDNVISNQNIVKNGNVLKQNNNDIQQSQNLQTVQKNVLQNGIIQPLNQENNINSLQQEQISKIPQNEPLRTNATNNINMRQNNIQNDALYTKNGIKLTNRTMQNVSKRNVNSIQHDYPNLKTMIQSMSSVKKQELEEGLMNSGGKAGHFVGKGKNIKYVSTVPNDIKNFKQETGATYDNINKAYNDIIEDNGKENYALAKKLEVKLIDDLKKNDSGSYYEIKNIQRQENGKEPISYNKAGLLRHIENNRSPFDNTVYNLNPRTGNYTLQTAKQQLQQTNQTQSVQQPILQNIQQPQQNIQYSQTNMLPTRSQIEIAQKNGIDINDRIMTSAIKYLDINNEKSQQVISNLKTIRDLRNKTAKGNLSIEFDDTIKGNGVIIKNGNERIIRLNPNSNGNVEFVIMHELTHDLEGTKEYADLQRIVKEYVTNSDNKAKYDEAVQGLSNMYNEYYQKNGLDTSNLNIDNEVVADVIGQLLGDDRFIQRLTTNRNVFQRIRDWINKQIDILKSSDKEATRFLYNVKDKFEKAYKSGSNNVDNNGLLQYHISENLSSDIDNLLLNGATRTNVKLRDYTPSILVQSGIKDLPMLMNSKHIIENILSENEAKSRGLTVSKKQHYHGLGKETFIKAIDSLDNPIGIFQWQKNNNNIYDTNDYIILTRVQNKNNENIIVPIYIETQGDYYNILTGNSERIDTNKVKTVYGKPQIYSYLNKYIKDGSLKNIKINRSIIDNGRVQFPTGANNTSTNSISQNNNTVNSNTMQNSQNNTQHSITNTDNNINHKKQQLDIIKNSNPMTDDYHTGIRSVDDIKTFAETLQDSDYEGWENDGFTPDYTGDMAKQALDTGKITVYSSYPIEQGVFVTPSKMEAQNYAGNGKVYEKMIDLNEVAWIEPMQGQYAKVDNVQNSITDNYKWNKFLQSIDMNKDKQTTSFKEIRNDKSTLPTRASQKSNTQMSVTDKEKTANILNKLPTKKTKAKEEFDKVYQQIVNKGHYVDKLAKEKNNPELKYKYDKMLGSIAEGQYVIGKAQTDENGRKIGKSINEIWKPVEEAGKVEEFSEYLLHKHNIDRMAQGKPVFGENVTADISKNIVKDLENKNSQFIEWSKDINTFNKNQLQIMVNAGLTTKETQELLNDMYNNYVRIQRDRKHQGAISTYYNNMKVNVPLKKAKGGNSDIFPLKDSMSLQAIQIKNAIRRNEFGLELLKTLGGEKVDSYTDIVASSTKYTPATFTVFKDGQPYKINLTEELYKSIKPTQQTDFEQTVIAKGLQKALNIQRELLTSSNPFFMITNPLKDVQDALFNTKYSTSKFVKNYGKAFKEIAQNSENWQLYQALGGNQNTYFDYNKGVLPTKKGKIRSFASKIKSVNEVLEQAPRFAEFLSTKEHGGSDMEAMYNSAEVTTNFKRGGEATKFVNRNFANFLNASVQGFDKFFRNFSEQNGAKGYVNILIKAVALGVVPAIINNLLLKDDEDYKELPDYIKDKYYVFKYRDNKFIRIPIGRALSIFNSATRRGLEKLQGKKNAFEGYMGNALEQIAPSNPLDNNIFVSFMQVANNKSWFGEDIVPSRLQNRRASEQYDEETDEISKFIGQHINYSPKKINYLLDQYGGGISDVVLPLLTPKSEENPLKVKFTTDSLYNNRNIQDFYDIKDEYTRERNFEKDNGIQEETATSLTLAYINKQNKLISDLYSAQRNIQNSKELTTKQKQEDAREIQRQIIALERATVNSIEKYQEIAYKNLEKYKDNDIAKAYTNKEIFGSEYALQVYNKAVYEKYQKSNKNADEYFEKYFNDLSKKRQKENK